MECRRCQREDGLYLSDWGNDPINGDWEELSCMYCDDEPSGMRLYLALHEMIDKEGE